MGETKIIEWTANLGKLARDKITGFEGVITAKAAHLYGCDSYFVISKVKDGEIKEGHWFDDGRIEIIEEVVKPSDVQVEKNGGEKLTAPDRF